MAAPDAGILGAFQPRSSGKFTQNTPKLMRQFAPVSLIIRLLHEIKFFFDPLGECGKIHALKGDFSTQFLDLRIAAGLTQSQVANDCGISLRTVRNYEYGLSEPGPERAQMLIGFLKRTRKAPGPRGRNSLLKQHLFLHRTKGWCMRCTIRAKKSKASVEMALGTHKLEKARNVLKFVIQPLARACKLRIEVADPTLKVIFVDKSNIAPTLLAVAGLDC